MRKSSIAKVQWGPRSAFAVTVGCELRRLRRERGYTQTSVAAPLTAAFLSAVEHGIIVPSLPSLVLLLEGLDVSLATFFRGVETQLAGGTWPELPRPESSMTWRVESAL